MIWKFCLLCVLHFLFVVNKLHDRIYVLCYSRNFLRIFEDQHLYPLLRETGAEGDKCSTNIEGSNVISCDGC